MTEDERTKKALAAGALGLGAAGLATRGSGERSELALQQVPGQALVFAYEYNPGLSFQVVNRLQQGTVDSILGREVDGDPIVSDPADYNGYVIRYQPGQAAGEYAFIFVRDGTLTIGNTFAFGTDATYFSSEVNLITAGLGTADGATETPTDETTTETTTPEAETTTPAEETTTPAEETTTTTETTPANGAANETTTEAVEINATTTQTDGG